MTRTAAMGFCGSADSTGLCFMVVQPFDKINQNQPVKRNCRSVICIVSVLFCCEKYSLRNIEQVPILRYSPFTSIACREVPSNCIPHFSMTRRLEKFPSMKRASMRLRDRYSKANFSTASALSAAMPIPQNEGFKT